MLYHVYTNNPFALDVLHAYPYISISAISGFNPLALDVLHVYPLYIMWWLHRHIYELAKLSE